MLACVAEVLRHGTASVWGKKLQRSCVGGGGSNNCGVLHAVILPKDLEELCHGGTLLADGNVDAIEMSLLVRTGIDRLLVQDGVDGNGCFPRLAVANDELPLPTSNGDKAVHGLDPSRHGFMHALAWNDSRCLQLDSPSFLCGDRSCTINGSTKRVNNATKQLISDWYIHNGSCALYAVPFYNSSVITKDDNTNVVGLQV
mmetsp:Transcript_45084/g.82407  ORF Transcript_45084/g.82407 Transcript_45084/m.82407 type:complete len:200 (-) Transcript_45084:383-982(-)